MSEIVPYPFEGTDVRVVDRNGDPWFFLVDVCRALDIGNPSMAAKRLDEAEKDRMSNVETANFNELGSYGAMPTIISEPGLYRLTFTSRKPAAERFTRWVAAVVLPAVRKNGGLGAAPLADTDDTLLARAVLIAQAKLADQSKVIVALTNEVAVLEPKAQALDRLGAKDGSLCVMDAAKVLKVQPKAFTKKLIEDRWLYRRGGNAHLVGYQDKVQAGLLEHRVFEIPNRDGGERVIEQPLITAKGLAKLAEAMSPRQAALAL
jgi:prophage antirepressor-like protein